MDEACLTQRDRIKKDLVKYLPAVMSYTLGRDSSQSKTTLFYDIKTSLDYFTKAPKIEGPRRLVYISSATFEKRDFPAKCVCSVTYHEYQKTYNAQHSFCSQLVKDEVSIDKVKNFKPYFNDEHILLGFSDGSTEWRVNDKNFCKLKNLSEEQCELLEYLFDQRMKHEQGFPYHRCDYQMFKRCNTNLLDCELSNEPTGPTIKIDDQQLRIYSSLPESIQEKLEENYLIPKLTPYKCRRTICNTLPTVFIIVIVAALKLALTRSFTLP